MSSISQAESTKVESDVLATPGVSGKKRARQEEEGDIISQRIPKMVQCNASENVQQPAFKHARVAEACIAHLRRITVEAQKMVRFVHESMQEWDSFTAKYADHHDSDLLKQHSNDMQEYMTTMKECIADLDVKTTQAFTTLTTNHAELSQARWSSALTLRQPNFWNTRGC